MSNPFLRNKAPNAASSQAAPVSAPLNQRQGPPSAFSAPPTAFQQPVQPFVPTAQNTKMVAPPPTTETIAQQMSNMSLQSAPPPTNSVPPPPSGHNQSSYLGTKGRYQVPSTAYQYGSVTQANPSQSPYGSAYNEMASQIAPAYIGQGASYDARSPAPAAVDPSLMPDEEYAKLSYEVAPNSPSLQNLCSLPFGGVFRPMAPEGSEIPTVAFHNISIPRCKRCRLYVNPFVQFTDAGRHWKCNMCGYMNDVPEEYFSPLDMNGKRLDLQQRPELLKGQVEFEAGSEYCVRPPAHPTFLFLIDTSYQSVATGMLQSVCSAIRGSLNDLIENIDNPIINVAFITYDETIRFYQLREDHTPKQMIFSDINEIFLPAPSSLFINLVDCCETIDSFLEVLPGTFADNKATSTCTMNALQFGATLLQDCGGKILIFQASMPSIGNGKLKNREGPSVLGTEAETALYKSDNAVYEKVANLVVDKQMSIDFFLCSAQYADVATLSTLNHLTGGQFFFYPNFMADSPQVEALYADIHHVLSRETGFEAVFRVRVPTGAKIRAFCGNFTISHQDLMVVPICHSDMTITLEFELEEVLSMPSFTIQSALLYTNSRGERRIRVHTLSIPISNVLSHLYERINPDVITAVILQRSIMEMSIVGGATVRKKIDRSCYTIVNGVKAQEANVSNEPIPSKVQLIPLYFLAMMKCSALRGGTDNKSDYRLYAMQQLSQCSISTILRYLYPTLFSLSDMNDNTCTFVENTDSLPASVQVYGDRNMILPPILNLSINALSATGVYLLDDGLSFWMVVGDQADPNMLMELFGVPSLVGYDVSNIRLPLLENETSRKIHALLDELRVDRPYYCPLKIVRATDPDFNFVKWRLVEDRDVFPGGNYSYGEYVQALLKGGSSIG